MTLDGWIDRTIGGRYKIEALLGQGGMSAVFRAYDPNLRRTVAVKLIHSHLSDNEEFLRRFEEEAASVAQLRHPNIIQVYDFNHDSGMYYMVMEYIAGESLLQRLQRLNASGRRLPYVDIIRHMINVCDAVDYAHKRSMIHRDIKPANVMLDLNGGAILMDFGIAKIIGGQQHTATGAVIGTALYMSPEQIRSERFDHRTDIYSIGVTLFEMIHGRPPFEAEAAMTLMMMHLNDPPPNLRLMHPDVPDELVRIVEKAMAKDAGHRFQSAAEMASALRKLLSNLGMQMSGVDQAGSAIRFSGPVAPRSSPHAIAAHPSAQLSGRTNAGTSRPVEQSRSGVAASPVNRGGLLAVGCAAITLGLAVLIGGGALIINQLLPGKIDLEATERVFAITGTAVMETRLALATATHTSTSTPPPTVVGAVTPVILSPVPPTLTPESILAPVTPTGPAVPTPIPPGVPYALIIGVTLDGGAYRVEYETIGFIESPSGKHIHFYFNNINPTDAGFPGAGPWFMHTGPRPFSSATVSDRPPGATQICALVAEPNHSVHAGSGNCADLPSSP